MESSAGGAGRLWGVSGGSKAGSRGSLVSHGPSVSDRLTRPPRAGACGRSGVVPGSEEKQNQAWKGGSSEDLGDRSPEA